MKTKFLLEKHVKREIISKYVEKYDFIFLSVSSANVAVALFVLATYTSFLAYNLVYYFVFYSS